MSNYDVQRVVAYEDEDIKVDVEVVDNHQPYIHCSVYNNNKSTLKKARQLFEDIKDWFGANGIEHVYTYTSNIRFAEFINPNFKSLGTISDGVEVLEW